MATFQTHGAPAEHARLRRLALRYEALASAEGGVTWVLDSRLRPTGRNEAWERYTGQGAHDYDELGWLSAVHGDDRDRVRGEAAGALARSEPLTLEIRIRRADGVFRRNVIRAVPVHEGGTVVEWIGTATDVEEARQAADDLAAVEQRLREAHAAAGVGTWEWNLEKDVITWSSEVFQMLQVDPGCTPGEQLWNERIHPDDREGTGRRWQDALASKVTHFSDSFRLLLPDGSVRWILSSAVIFRDPSGHAIRAVGLDMDVTRQRTLQEQIEQALDEARDVRARLLALTDGAESLLASRDEGEARAGVVELAQRVLPADGYAIWWLQTDKHEWRIVHAAGLSEAFASERLTGEPIKLVQPIAIEDALAPEVSNARRAAYLAEGIASLLTVPLPIRGERRATLVAYYRTPHRCTETELRVGIALGQIAAAALGNAETNAAQDRARADAQRQAARMAYLAHASALLATLDYETTLRQIARMAVPEIVDWCAVDLVQPDGRVSRIVTAHLDADKVQLAHTLHDRYPADPNAEAGVANVLRTGLAEFYPWIPDDLLERWAQDAEHLRLMKALGLKSALIAPLTARGRTLGAISFVSSSADRALSHDDVTVLTEVARRAALAIDNARLYAEAQLASRAKDDFLALLSHELRTPLNAIMGWTHMLRQGLPEEARAQAVEVITRNAHMQKQLVEDLLDVARIASGRIDLQRTAVDLREAARAAVDSSLPAVRGRNLRVDLDVGADPVTVHADHNRLQQATANLLSNAIKFTEADGRIVVRVRQDAIGAHLSVSDTGVGISADFLPYVFDRFRQADTSLTRRHSGLGLGLWIVKQIIDAHGGQVRAESEGTGRGATVTVTFPIAHT